MRILKRISLLIGIPLLIIVVLLIPPILSPSEGVRCWSLHRSLTNALDQASSVVVTEHSDYSDRFAFGSDYKERTYAKVALTPKQIDDLRTALPFSMDFGGGILKCKFEEHHLIEIKHRDGTVTTLHLCFHCGQVYINDHQYQGVMPPGWPSSLSGFISSLGLHPDGPWDKNPDAAN